MRIITLSVLFLEALILFSCKPEIAQYDIDSIDDSGLIKLSSLNILGAINYTDTTCSEFLDKDHLLTSGTSEKAFCKSPYDIDIEIKNEFKVNNGFKFTFYKTDEPIVDFKAICPGSESDLVKKKGSAVYYYCKLNNTNEKTVFLLTRSSNGIKVWLNGDSVYRSYEPKGFELTFSEYIPLKLKKGTNSLVIKIVNHSNEMLFEGIICDKEVAIQEYQKKTTFFILKNPIVNDTLWLLSNHVKDMDSNITYSISDLDGKILITNSKDTSSNNFILVKTLKQQQTYVCRFTLSNHTFEQPFYVGDPDSALKLFTEKSRTFSGNPQDTTEIGSYLYRLKFLLGHSSRVDDWWWKYKISSIICELSNIFNNLEKGQPIYKNSFGIQFRSYISTLDQNVQRYLLIQPDNIDETKKSPLVVVLRPHIENNHHFLSSPQLARYWSLTNAKYLANKYGYIIIMPEGRLYLNEPLIPMAESEILQTIENVQKVCNVDSNRIFLHGNCTAGNRSLILACHNPDKYAAIGLYAPIYNINSQNTWQKQNSPEMLLNNLSNTPIELHYDPTDTHSPYVYYKKLISDSKTNKIPIKVTSSLQSSLHYNVLLVGEETLSFFKDKKRESQPKNIRLSFFNNQHNSFWWLSGSSLLADKKSILEANYNEHRNTISITGESISSLCLDLKSFTFKNKPLKILYNRKTVFEGILENRNYTFKIVAKSPPIKQYIIADLFSEPFIFVIDQSNKNPKYLEVVDSLRKEYTTYLFSNIPIKNSDELTANDLSKNLFLIGHNFENKTLQRIINQLPIRIASNSILINNQSYNGKKCLFQCIFENPINKTKKIVVYRTNDYKSFQNGIGCPWKYGLGENSLL